jgi:DNA mismatch endonuclease (patch repair protein)
MSRSENMRRIRSRDTSPELVLRRHLYARGIRFVTCVKDLPGKPDIVNRRRRLAIFVHGCFWHQHSSCIDASRPKTNTDYWLPKLERNVARDKAAIDELSRRGFRVLVAWDCEIMRDVDRVVQRIGQILES